MLIALGSAKGSPGVSTLASALGSVWHGPVIVADCDPAGGDMSLRHRDRHGQPLDPERGLLSLAAAARRGIDPSDVYDHVQTLAGGLDVLAGVSRPEQLTGVGPVWPSVAGAFRELPDSDVIVDCGRVTAGTPVLPLLTAADVVAIVVQPNVENYAHLRERLRWLVEPLRMGDVGSVPVGVVLVTSASDKSAMRDLNRLLEYDGLQVSVVGRIADDVKAADALAGRRQRRIDRSLLIRSAREVAGAIVGLATDRRYTPSGRG